MDGFDISPDAIAKARASGYSDADIVGYLAPKAPDKFSAAQQAGYSPTEILDHLAPPDQGGPVDISTGLTFEGLKHAATVPTEAAKGVPVAGAFVPDTADTKMFEQDQPGLAAATRGIGGALAVAPAMAMAPELFGMSAALPLATNVAAGAATGGVIGAADAAARGEPIVQGGVTGALTAGAAPIVGKGIGALFGSVMKYLSPKAAGALQGYDPKALEWAAKTAKDSGLNEQQIAAQFEKLGPKGFLAEYSAGLQGLANKVASAPGGGEGKMGLISAFEQRAAPEAQKSRIQEGLDTLLGKPKNMVQTGIENAAEREAQAGPLFDQFRQMKVTPTAEIKTLTEQLEPLGLFNDAKRVAQIKAAATGEPVAPTENFFTTGERKDWPTTESWSYVKQAIDDKIANSYDQFGNATQNTRLYRQLKARIDNAVANSSPETAKVWGQARDIWESSKALDNARREGEAFWNTGYNKDQAIQDLTDMSQAERNAFKEAARTALRNKMEATVGGDTATRNMLRSANAKAKMHMLAENKAVSPKDVDEFLNQMDREATYGPAKSGLGTSIQKEANKAAEELLTPNPEETGVAKFAKRTEFTPGHVTMSPYFPMLGSLKKAAARRQEAAYTAARDSLGKMLAKQGEEAPAILKALLNYKQAGAGAPQAGLTSAAIARALAQPSVPGVPVPVLPPWAGGTTQ